MADSVIRVNFGSVVDDEDFGVVSLASVREKRDPLLTGPEVAARLGITASGWRSLVCKQYAPIPDDPGFGPVNRRQPRWRVSTIDAWVPTRPGRTGRPRKRA